MSAPYDWHVAAAGSFPSRAGRPRLVYYVQRYLPPTDPRRFTGEVATRTWDSEAEAQALADLANTGAAIACRATYL